jgi:nucleoside-triphosphatase
LKILLEGRPGVGKTTVARRVAELLRHAGVAVSGFVTTEMREDRRRVGFAIETFDGKRGTLAHVDFRGPPRVGKYGVDLAAFERLALPALEPPRGGGVVVIDELGKMELASESFRNAVTAVLKRGSAVLATVQLGRRPFSDEIKRRRDVEVLRVNERNRDELPRELAQRLIIGRG